MDHYILEGWWGEANTQTKTKKLLQETNIMPSATKQRNILQHQEKKLIQSFGQGKKMDRKKSYTTSLPSSPPTKKKYK